MVAHAARTVTHHHLVYWQVSLAQWLFFADRGIDWYRVSTRDWSIFCVILWFAFFLVYFIAFVHRHDVLKYHMLLKFIRQRISSNFMQAIASYWCMHFVYSCIHEGGITGSKAISGWAWIYANLIAKWTKAKVIYLLA